MNQRSRGDSSHLVILDACVAFGALLGVGEDPVGGLRLVHALLVPVHELGASAGLVCLFTTLRTECRSARTTHCTYTRADCNFVAIGSGAVLHAFGHLDEVPQHVDAVLVEFSRVDRCKKMRVNTAGDGLSTFVLRTMCKDTSRAITNLIAEIFGVARAAKLVSTS